eukprot:m.57312 g.57312  ORF g.57312 m.57312 type:complete len:277 (-) comp22365_c0_seq1:405-1235(-)
MATIIESAKISFAVNFLTYALHAAPYKSEYYYDATGAASYLLVVVNALIKRESSTPRSNILTATGLVWSLRLGWFLFQRIRRDKVDRRMTLKKSRLLFAIPFVLQALWILALSLPSVVTNLYVPTVPEVEQPLSVLDYSALAMWAYGFAIEVVADRQKRAFAEAGLRETKGYISTGIWASSRHPNYMGEILLWLGSSIFAYSSLRGSTCERPAVVFAAPMMTYFLLMHLSGVPLLEKRALKKWGAQAEYQTYLKNTPVVFASPLSVLPKLFAALTQ